jgi:mevalonate kinase
MTVGTAPGKIILLGEHSVVYRRPALAVPISSLIAKAITLDHDEAGLLIKAPDVNREVWLAEADPADPLAKAVRATLAALDRTRPPRVAISVESELPIAAGLGSGAAVSIAIIRSLSKHLGSPLKPADQAALAFEVEKLHHGTPSGIDNTVIAHGAPVYFIKGAPLETFEIGQSTHLLIADCGIESPTAESVAGVRQRWQADKQTYEGLFDEIGQRVNRARQALAVGNLELLGRLMDENQDLLAAIGVSSPELEKLVNAARSAGALGAKLSGGGMGGNMIALIVPEKADEVKVALEKAGAHQVLAVEVGR